MFPKRKLDESRSGSESQKEEEGAKDEQVQCTKRPRVDSGGTSPSKASPAVKLALFSVGTALTAPPNPSTTGFELSALVK